MQLVADTAAHDIHRTCWALTKTYQVTVVMNVLYMSEEEAQAAAAR